MRPTPLPKSWAGQVFIIGDTSRGLAPCTYAVAPSQLFPGRPRVVARIELTAEDRHLISQGAVLWLEMDGGELPWQLTLTDPNAEVPLDG